MHPPDPAKAAHEFRNRDLASHIDAIEGRALKPEPAPVDKSRPEPEEPRDDGPSF